MKALICIAGCMALSACDKSPTPEISPNEIPITKTDLAKPSPSAPVHGPGEIRTSASIAEGSPSQTVYLVPIGDASKRKQMSEMMRQSGFECNSVSNAYQLRQEDGKFIDVFKIDCDTGNFQATIMNDKLYLKLWAGNLLNKAPLAAPVPKSDRVNEVARSIYKERCLAALTEGNDPAVMQIPKDARDALCTDTSAVP